MIAPTPPDPPATLIITTTRHALPGLPGVLREQGFLPWTCETRTELHSLLALRRWDLVVLDIRCTAAWGPERCSGVRELHAGPLAAVTRDCSETAQAMILEAGIDDVMSWPLSPELLGARLRALFRRYPRPSTPNEQPGAPLRIGGLVIDPARREASLQGRRVDLTDLEFRTLHLLARHAGNPVSRETLFRELRGLPYDTRDRSIDLRVSRLRRKLGDDGEESRLIITVRGTGYQLAAGAL